MSQNNKVGVSAILLGLDDGVSLLPITDIGWAMIMDLDMPREQIELLWGKIPDNIEEIIAKYPKKT